MNPSVKRASKKRVEGLRPEGLRPEGLRPEARYPLPECVVPPLESAEVFTSLPAMRGTFRPTWFSIPEDVALHLLVTDVKVGKNSQFASVGCFPASLFTSLASSSGTDRLRMDYMGDGIELRVSITNTSTKPVKFSGEVLGLHAKSISDPPRPERGLLVCGLGHNLVLPGAFNLRVQSQLDLVPSRLFIPEHVLKNFVVREMAVRPYSHGSRTSGGVLSSGDGPVTASVPALMLTNEWLRSRGVVRLEPSPEVGRSAFIGLNLVNKSKKPQWFNGAILG